MSKKKNLLNLFTQDVIFNFHLIKTEEPIGHLIYIINGDKPLEVDSLEFTSSIIIEELMTDCSIKFEKFAPSIFFSEEENTEKLKYELKEKFSESLEFSEFIETIKDEYRILEVRDSLLYKKDPEAYKEAKNKEKEEHQKELFDQLLDQLKNKKDKREEAILAYDNNIFKLLKEYLQDIIEYEKRDFNFNSEFERLVNSLIDVESWIKIDDKPYVCKIEIISLNENTIDVFLTDNINSYTATFRFDKTLLITENVVKLDEIESIKYLKDYEILAQLYDVDLTTIAEWDFKNDTDRFEYIIDYLAPIFKIEKDKKQKEYIDKILASENDEDIDDDDDDEDIDDEIDEADKDENGNIIKMNTLTPDKYYFSVTMGDPSIPSDELNPPVIALTSINYFQKYGYLDDRLGSHNIGKNIKKALKNAGIEWQAELMEAMWAVEDYTRTEQDIIDSMVKEGFIHNQNITN